MAHRVEIGFERNFLVARAVRARVRRCMSFAALIVSILCSLLLLIGSWCNYLEQKFVDIVFVTVVFVEPNTHIENLDLVRIPPTWQRSRLSLH